MLTLVTLLLMLPDVAAYAFARTLAAGPLKVRKAVLVLLGVRTFN